MVAFVDGSFVVVTFAVSFLLDIYAVLGTY